MLQLWIEGSPCQGWGTEVMQCAIIINSHQMPTLQVRHCGRVLGAEVREGTESLSRMSSGMKATYSFKYIGEGQVYAASPG